MYGATGVPDHPGGGGAEEHVAPARLARGDDDAVMAALARSLQNDPSDMAGANPDRHIRRTELLGEQRLRSLLLLSEMPGVNDGPVVGRKWLEYGQHLDLTTWFEEGAGGFERLMPLITEAWIEWYENLRIHGQDLLSCAPSSVAFPKAAESLD